MWLREELLALQVNNLSVRQQLDLLQDNAYIRRNLDYIINIKLSLNLIVKKEDIGKNLTSRHAQEINIAWNNICSYIRLAFPKVWCAIHINDVLCENTINTELLYHSQTLNQKIHSCKKITEVFKTIVYGGSLRVPFSQDKQARALFADLLVTCQTSDTSGSHIIASQKRIVFLQNWIEKLVFNSPLPSFLIKNTTCFAGSITPPVLKKEPAQITNTKFTVSKISRSKVNSLQHTKDISVNSQSSQSFNTSFSSYIEKKTKPPNFVGIKIKFESDSNSSSESDTDHSDRSIWKPVFKKRRTK